MNDIINRKEPKIPYRLNISYLNFTIIKRLKYFAVEYPYNKKYSILLIILSPKASLKFLYSPFCISFRFPDKPECPKCGFPSPVVTRLSFRRAQQFSLQTLSQ